MVNNKINVNVIDGLQPILDRVVDYDNITNCITEIPQNIKLELVNGVLTLKAGSKVYVPNGVGKFDEVVIKNDLARTTFSANATTMVFYNTVGGMQQVPVSGTFSGTGEIPANGIYYKTDTNVFYVNGVQTALSLPMFVAKTDANGVITSIDQVFNGFGYIGSTAFILPGVKFLVPNGRNEDGTLKNIEMVEDRVHTLTITWNNSGGQKLFIGKYDLNTGSTIQYISTGSLSQYYQQETEPSMERYIVWYKPSENKTYRCDQDSSGNLIWKDIFPCYVGEWFTGATSPYQITSLTTTLPFRAVDQNDFNKLDEEAVKLTGNQTIAGSKTFSSSLTTKTGGSAMLKGVLPNNTVGTNPSSDINVYVAGVDNGGKDQSYISFVVKTDGTGQTNLIARSNSSSDRGGSGITVARKLDGTSWTSIGTTTAAAPTPATTDNSTKIATTAWFRNNMQVVSALPSSPTAGVFYFVKE